MKSITRVSNGVKFSTVICLAVLVVCVCFGAVITKINSKVNALWVLRHSRGFDKEELLKEMKRQLPALSSRVKRDVKNYEENVTNTVTDTEKVQTKLVLVTPGDYGGASYTRWGRKVCGADSELVYEGIAGGGWYASEGSAVNPLCLTREPKWNQYNDAVAGNAYIYGTEYEFSGNPFLLKNAEALFNGNMPCAVCISAIRKTSIMVPGRNDCFSGWTLEYEGYLVAGYHSHKKASQYICLDEAPEVAEAGYRDEGGQLFYVVEAICGSLPCPEYVNGREITCAVCTK